LVARVEPKATVRLLVSCGSKPGGVEAAARPARARTIVEDRMAMGCREERRWNGGDRRARRDIYSSVAYTKGEGRWQPLTLLELYLPTHCYVIRM